MEVLGAAGPEPEVELAVSGGSSGHVEMDGSKTRDEGVSSDGEDSAGLGWLDGWMVDFGVR